MECEFCKKVFKNKYSLSNHQKTTKNCLLLQGKLEDETILKYECNFCNKKFSLKQILEDHVFICKFKKQEEKESILKQVEILKEELKQKDIEILLLKNEIRVKNEIKYEIDKKDDKKEDKYLNTIKEVVSKSNKTTNNTINNIYIQQQLDKLIPINELPNLIASSPHLSNTLKSLDSLEKFYYLCANESKKCFLVKDSSREIVSGRKVDENNNVEYITGKIQSLLGDYIVNEDLCKKVKEEYSVMLDNINSTEELTSEEGDSGENLQQLCYKLYKSKKEKVVDEDLVNNISKKAMTVLFKIKKEDYP